MPDDQNAAIHIRTNTIMKNRKQLLGIALACAMTAPAMAQDWPQWGRNGSKNLYTPAKGLPSKFNPGEFKR